MALPLVLAGPIVRRVEPSAVAVWIALSQPRRVSLQLFRGPVVLGGGSLPAVEATGAADTVAFAANLHVAVVQATPTAPVTFLTPGTFYSYNLSFAPTPGGGGTASDLAGEGLLADGNLANGLPHLALGYGANALPGLRTPPAALSELRIGHGSCRKPHDLGVDALAELDNRLRPGTPPEDPPLDAPPHLLVLTGDQIYADDVALSLLPTINRLGQELTGGAPESLPLTTGNVAATLANLPAGLRQRLVQQEGKLTSGSAECHLLSFEEFAAMYLLCFSNAVWPATLPPPTDVNAAPTPGQPPPVRDAIETDPVKLVDQNCQRRQRYCQQLTGVLGLRDGLAKVRRALANVATYMIFDDHEITDDWYLTLDWKRSVLGSGLGKTLVRNGLSAYGVFQGWGNDPAAFAAGGANAGLLTEIAQAMTTRGAPTLAALDARLGLVAPFDSQVSWHYQAADTAWRFGLLVLDTRTRRGYRTPIAPPALISPAAMGVQIPPPSVDPAGRDVLFVLAAAPVLGVPVVEELFQPAAARVSNLVHSRQPGGNQDADLEPWSGDPAAFEQLLAQLAPARRVVFLSGDVHFAHGAGLTYWTSAPQPARFAQFTSSALKNSADEFQRDLLRSFGFGQRVFRSGQGTARLGWNDADPNPLAFPADAPLVTFPLEVRARFRTRPLLLPAAVWPAGVTALRPADFTWRLDLARDGRPESERPPEDRPTLPPDLQGPGPIPLTKLPEVARYHSAALLTRGLSRQQVFTHNLGLVSIEVEVGHFIARHTLMSPPVTDPAVLEPITVHRVPLDPDPAEPRPTLQP